LCADGYHVTGLVRPGDQAAAPIGLQIVTGDLADSQSLCRAVEVAAPDEVYNLAGVSSVAQSWAEPELTADVTGVGLLRLICAVRDHTARTGQVPRIVQASSAEIFGHADAPQNEQTPLAPATPYGAAKAFAHHLVGVYRNAGMSVSSAILYNHESPRRPESFVTRRITCAVARLSAGGSEPLRLGNLNALRDWGFAGDYARALHLIARHPVPDDFIIATGSSRSVAEFVATAFAQVGIDNWRDYVEIDDQFVRPADPGEQRGDASKARRELGWAPRMTFEELVASMVQADLHMANQPDASSA
jgi:GDPmannose 4,6-dehydratase